MVRPGYASVMHPRQNTPRTSALRPICVVKYQLSNLGMEIKTFASDTHECVVCHQGALIQEIFFFNRFHSCNLLFNEDVFCSGCYATRTKRCLVRSGNKEKNLISIQTEVQVLAATCLLVKL